MYTLIGWGLFDDKLMGQQINHLILMERIGKLVRTDIYEILVHKRDFKVFFWRWGGMQMVWLLGRVGGGEGRGLLEQNTKVGISQKKKKKIPK